MIYATIVPEAKKARTAHSFVNACTNRFRHLNASANSPASNAASMDMQNRDKLSRQSTQLVPKN